MACNARNGGVEPSFAGPQACSSPTRCPLPAQRHALLCCPAGAMPRSSPSGLQKPTVALGRGDAFPPSSSFTAGRRGEQLCRPPAPRAILHVEAQQVVQHRLPAGRKRTGTAAAADLQGREPSAPHSPPAARSRIPPSPLSSAPPAAPAPRSPRASPPLSLRIPPGPHPLSPPNT